MSDKNSGITFRRIRGRIVPIKMTKKESHDLKVGSASVAAGSALTFASGKAYRKVISNSVGMSARGFFALEKAYASMKHGQLNFNDALRRSKLQETGLKLLKSGDRLSRVAPVLRKGVGIGLGSTLLGFGAMKIAKSQKQDISPEKAYGVASAASGFGFATGMYGRSAIHAIKPKIREMTPKLVNMAKKAIF